MTVTGQTVLQDGLILPSPTKVLVLRTFLPIQAHLSSLSGHHFGCVSAYSPMLCNKANKQQTNKRDFEIIWQITFFTVKIIDSPLESLKTEMFTDKNCYKISQISIFFVS